MVRDIGVIRIWGVKKGEIPCPITARVWYNFPVRRCNHDETESLDDIGRKWMPPYRVCDIESLITLSPNAVIFLFRFLVGACTLQVKGAEMLGNRVLWGISTYLAGLIILDRKRTATRIAGQFRFILNLLHYRRTNPKNKGAKENLCALALHSKVGNRRHLHAEFMLLPRVLVR